MHLVAPIQSRLDSLLRVTNALVLWLEERRQQGVHSQQASAGQRDIVLLNAAAALVVAGAAEGIEAGLELARASVASGGAAGALETLASVSHRA